MSWTRCSSLTTVFTCSRKPSRARFQIQAGGFLLASLANMRAQVILRKPAHHMCGPKWVGSPSRDSVGLQKSAVNLSPTRSHGPRIAHSLMPRPLIRMARLRLLKILEKRLFFRLLPHFRIGTPFCSRRFIRSRNWWPSRDAGKAKRAK